MTSTKQFVWCRHDRRESRDSSGIITAIYSDFGERIGGNNYFYSNDHLNSSREVSDNSGIVQSSYSYGDFGEFTKVLENMPAAFKYAGYYAHSRSGLSLTYHRAYSSKVARWLSRDPIQEAGGINLFRYVQNDPLAGTDPSGLQGITEMGICFYIAMFLAWGCIVTTAKGCQDMAKWFKDNCTACSKP